MANRPGKLSSLTINGVALQMVDGSVTESADDIDVTNTESSGFYTSLAGILRLDISFNAVWTDTSNQMPSGSTPGIIGGAQLSVTFTLYSGKTFTGTIQIDNVAYNTAVRDAVRYSVTGHCTGSYTDPS